MCVEREGGGYGERVERGGGRAQMLQPRISHQKTSRLLKVFTRVLLRGGVRNFMWEED